MIKKIISSLLAMWNTTASEQSELQEKSINVAKNSQNAEKQTYSAKEVDEYFFKVINWKKIDFECETDPDILRSYDEYNEGEYPLYLTESVFPNLYFFTNTNELVVKFQIFLTLDRSLRQRALFNNAEFIQEYFISHYNTCFFYDKDLVSTTNDFTKLVQNINIQDFNTIISPNLIPDLIYKVDTNSSTMLYYNWDFFRSNGNYEMKGVNLLCRFIQYLPYPDISKIQEPEKLKLYTYMNIEELASFTPDIELEGLEWNAQYFDDTFENDIFEQSKETQNGLNSKYKIKPKSRNSSKKIKNNPSRIKPNLEILEKWFFNDNNIKPFQIK